MIRKPESAQSARKLIKDASQMMLVNPNANKPTIPNINATGPQPPQPARNHHTQVVCPKRTVIRIASQHNIKNVTTRPTNVKTANKETVDAQSPKPNAQFWRNSENARRSNLKASTDTLW